MSAVKDIEKLTQKHLVKILEDAYKKGTESADLNSRQLVEEIATFLKPFVKSDQLER
ncbi:hypothetical protein [Halalkalibacter krulwichiae]|uniref:Uncharacterized protein n=1 Tax=Halalkalibacter krulwichiae TaxID=199441 RepID=A0A1X9MHW3_9BACI|nr:hypothetical protein [Halalkalibacter krulwichiae]ARK32294.1 hypothetical protein BkAM31D_21885 [Halalkalibacter krulwichiae]